MKWFLAIFLLLLAALFLQSGLLAYALYVLLGVLLVSRFLARNCLANLSARRTCQLLERDLAELPSPNCFRGRKSASASPCG